MSNLRFKTYFQYRNAWNQAKENTPKIPLNVDIELSSSCQLKCDFCFRDNVEFKSRPGFISAHLACKIIDECSEIGVPAIKFNWRGESTIHPHFSMIVEYAKSKNTFLDLLINTNGNFTQDAYDGLLACSKVMVSLDSCEPDLYRKMRPGGNLVKVISNITELISSGHRNIVIRRVICDVNKDERFVQNVRHLWGDSVKIGEHVVFDRANVHSYKKTIERIYCEHPSRRLIISKDGSIHPCCMDYFERMTLGHVDDGILNVWRGNVLEILRRNLKGNKFKGQCGICKSYSSYKTSERRLLNEETTSNQH
jgi:radical SAM protein with 4Fe4S-binding SPASM domain